MSRSTFSGPIRMGTIKYGPYYNLGRDSIYQTATINYNTPSTQVLLYIPAGSQIMDMTFDVTTAFNSVTSAYLTVGNAAAGFQYAGSASTVDIKSAAGRFRPTFTATQLTNMLSTSSDVSAATIVAATGIVQAQSALYLTVTQAGGAATAGSVTVSIEYIIPDDRSAVANQ